MQDLSFATLIVCWQGDAHLVPRLVGQLPSKMPIVVQTDGPIGLEIEAEISQALRSHSASTSLLIGLALKQSNIWRFVARNWKSALAFRPDANVWIKLDPDAWWHNDDWLGHLEHRCSFPFNWETPSNERGEIASCIVAISSRLARLFADCNAKAMANILWDTTYEKGNSEDKARQYIAYANFMAPSSAPTGLVLANSASWSPRSLKGFSVSHPSLDSLPSKYKKLELCQPQHIAERVRVLNRLGEKAGNAESLLSYGEAEWLVGVKWAEPQIFAQLRANSPNAELIIMENQAELMPLAIRLGATVAPVIKLK